MTELWPSSAALSTSDVDLVHRLRDELQAGAAVAAGALHAGPLLKRSGWRSWKKQFAVLTTEEIAWKTDDNDWQSLVFSSEIQAAVSDSTLSFPADLRFRAASEPELLMWHFLIGEVLERLAASYRIARRHAHESRTRLAHPFVEVPHAGSRNLRERSLSKLFYTCFALDQPIVPDRPLNSKSPAVWIYLLEAPGPSSNWLGEQWRAYRELCGVVASSGHPHLLPTRHVDVVVSEQRAVVYRPYCEGGSLRDLIYGVGDPRRPYSHKYGAWYGPGARSSRAAPLPTSLVSKIASSRLGLPSDRTPAPTHTNRHAPARAHAHTCTHVGSHART